MSLEEAQRLVSAVEFMAAAESVDDVMSGVCTLARGVAASDGSTFVLRDGGHCFYADEDSMRPLWKGERFPLTACISGWVMLHETPAVIGDIYSDERIPHEAYRPTFVSSLAMVPVGRTVPVAAIGNYWSERDRPDDGVRDRLGLFAESVASALARLGVGGELAPLLRVPPLRPVAEAPAQNGDDPEDEGARVLDRT